MDFLKIEARRNGYAPKQCGDTMTVGDLIELLEDYDEDMPIYLSHDNGYTYGAMEGYDFEECSCDE